MVTKSDDTLSCLDRILACNRRTDGHLVTAQSVLRRALCSKKLLSTLGLLVVMTGNS